MTQLTAACWTFRRTSLDVLACMPRGESLRSIAGRLMVDCGAEGLVALSTCNRFELYADSTMPLDPHAVATAVAGVCGLQPKVTAERLHLLSGPAAVHHLFSVAAGLDSRIVGEEEVLGQVRAAMELAGTADTLTPDLQALYQWAIRAGRRARRSAPLPRRRSAAVQAVDALDRLFAGLHGRQILVVGTGRMARGAIHALDAAGATVVACGRSSNLPDHVGAVQPLSSLPALLPTVDAVICATSAPTPLVTADMVGAALPPGRPRLPIVDLGVPANLDRQCTELAGVLALDLDALARSAGNDVVSAEQAHAASEVISEEVRKFLESQRVRDVGRLIAAVTERADIARATELARVAGRAGDAQPLLEEVTRRLVNKLVHDIVVGVRQRAALGDTEGAVLVAQTLAGASASNAVAWTDCA